MNLQHDGQAASDSLASLKAAHKPAVGRKTAFPWDHEYSDDSHESTSIGSSGDNSADSRKPSFDASSSHSSQNDHSRASSSTRKSSGSGSGLYGKLAGLFHHKQQAPKKEVHFDLDDMIKRLIGCANTFPEKCVITPEEIFWICKECNSLTMAQPCLIEVNGPIFICGDIHGQYQDLLNIFKECGGNLAVSHYISNIHDRSQNF